MKNKKTWQIMKILTNYSTSLTMKTHTCCFITNCFNDIFLADFQFFSCHLFWSSTYLHHHLFPANSYLLSPICKEKKRIKRITDFIYLLDIRLRSRFVLQGDKKKKHANWLFLGKIIQPNLPKFAYNLIRGRRVRIWSPIRTIPIPSIPKSRFKLSKISKNHFVRFFV